MLKWTKKQISKRHCKANVAIVIVFVVVFAVVAVVAVHVVVFAHILVLVLAFNYIRRLI